MRYCLKVIGCLIVGVCLLAFMVLPGSAAQDKGTVYYLVPTLIDDFQTESVSSIEKTLGSLGYKVVTLDGQNRSDVQINQLDDVILLKPTAIVIAAVDFDAVVTGIEKARAAGIPVLCFDRQIRSTMFDFTSVAGTVEMGQAAATETARLLKERYGSVKGKVLQIGGDPGDNYSLDIKKGFDETMKPYPDVEIVQKAALQWEPSNAGNVAENQLLAHKDIDLIVVHAGLLLPPVVAALEGRGYKKGDIMLISTNGEPIGLELIRTGWEQVEVEQPLYAQVYGLAMFIDKVIAGEKLEPGTYDVLGLPSTLTKEKWGMNLKIPGAVITKANVDQDRFWGNLKAPSAPVQVVK